MISYVALMFLGSSFCACLYSFFIKDEIAEFHLTLCKSTSVCVCVFLCVFLVDLPVQMEALVPILLIYALQSFKSAS